MEISDSRFTIKRNSQGQGETSDRSETTQREDDSKAETEKPTCQEIFLSHSGFQKNFVEQLHRDLTTQNMSSFFDRDPQSLPKGREFPSRIKENCRKCKVAVLVLSPEFLSSYWPMLELYTIVEAKNSSNPDVAILPLFFKISFEKLSEKLRNNELLPRWKELLEERKMEDCTDGWFKALKQIRKYNGLPFSERESEVSYRDKIVECIRSLLPTNLPYKDSHVEGKERLCQAVDSQFKIADGGNDMTMVGLYGIGGSGKTTISKIMCNFYAREYKGKVFHVEFGKETCLETQKKLLKVFAGAHGRLLDSATSKEQGWPVLERAMSERRVFLALDNISDDPESIDEAKSYLSLGFGQGCRFLLTTRSPEIFRSGLLGKGRIQLMEVPKFQEEEAIAILLKHTTVEPPNLTCEQKEIVKRCANMCCFGDKYHPLALEGFGASLFDEFGDDLTQWKEISDFGDAMGLEGKEVFLVFERSLKALSPIDVKIFMLLVLFLPDRRLDVETALRWLSSMCSKEVRYVRSVIRKLKKKALIEDDEYVIGVHDLIREFAEKQANEKSTLWCFLRRAEEIPISRNTSEGARLSHCAFPTIPITDGPDIFGSVLVLHLEYMSELTHLDLSSMKALRSLVIRHCDRLEEIRGIERLPKLHWLRVDADNLLLPTFPQGVGQIAIRYLHWSTPWTTRFVDLCKYLRLEYIHIKCRSLQEFPILGGLPNLERIILEDCPRVTEGADFSGCSKLVDAKLDGCPSMSSPPNLEGCSKLRRIYFGACDAMIQPPDFRACSELTYADFIGCLAMTRGPHLSGLSALKTVVFRKCSSMTEGPDLSGCTQLDSIRFEDCYEMRQPPILNGCSNLRFIKLTGSKKLDEFSSLDGLTALQSLWVDESVRFEKAQAHFEVCIGQTSLTVQGSESLKELSRDIPDYLGFIRLALAKCGGLSGYFSFVGLSSVRRFTLWECEWVVEPPDLAGCGLLESVEIKGCKRLRRFPSFAGLSNLKWLVLRECQEVSEPPDLRGCTGLVGIDLRDNLNMEGEPSMLDCASLRRLQLTWRHNTAHQKRVPPLLVRCPIFRFRSSLQKLQTRIYSLADQQYQYIEFSLNLLE